MGAEPIQDWQKTLASTLEWWRDAGVDMLVEDDPHDWLIRAAPPVEPATNPVAVAAPVAEVLPDTLDAFVEWRLSDSAPEAGWHAPRFAPTGPKEAEWVLLTDMPEAEDDARLMEGPAGQLLDRMLAAIGLSRESVHLASLVVARPMTGRIPPEQEPRLIELARHHLSLLRPKKLLLLGQAASRVLAETNGTGGPDSIHAVNHFGAKTLLVATFHPRFLLERPVAKSEAWKHLLLLSRGPSE
ncbi:uracil-DNA glycosylase family protein [Sphingomonas sp. S2-65]|uniref:uracil-DNA glycosylase family protein n=1 Tax=Sphingomonas sp. S2-65 TaxID=2903960 RepID=UPI001F176F94|nr:uracil-DNA glycosylase family protein [Sphingomonas sp. S2-65]UYY59133.1 uracil-DNA glycosylase [Sphingomonas sp. S2-65]